MKLIYRKRGRGKTLKLIQKCVEMNKEPNNLTYILVADRKSSLWLSSFAKRKNYNIPFPLTLAEVPIRSCGTFIRNILVDDVEDILRAITGNRFNISMITMTKEE